MTSTNPSIHSRVIMRYDSELDLIGHQRFQRYLVASGRIFSNMPLLYQLLPRRGDVAAGHKFNGFEAFPL